MYLYRYYTHYTLKKRFWEQLKISCFICIRLDKMFINIKYYNVFVNSPVILFKITYIMLISLMSFNKIYLSINNHR